MRSDDEMVVYVADELYARQAERDRLTTELAIARAENGRLSAENEGLRAEVWWTRYGPRVAAIRDERDALAVFCRWLLRMDDPDDKQGRAERQTVTLTQIIDRARAALAAVSSEPEDGPNDGYDYPMRVTEDGGQP